MLRAPMFGELVRKSVIARWTRTLSTMFAAARSWTSWRRTAMPALFTSTSTAPRSPATASKVSRTDSGEATSQP